MLRILLICGVGASTGFMAQKMRSYAKTNGIEVSVKAVSEKELIDYVDEIDVLLVGPHYKSKEEFIRNEIKGYPIKMDIIKSDYYATMNGEMILKQALDLVEK